MHIQVSDPYSCCGCTACYNICPKGAITMESDSLGFRYPFVNGENCIECGLCLKVCEFHSDYKRQDMKDLPLVYGCRNPSEKELAKSQSGGLAYEIGKIIIESGGIVYGVVMDSPYNATHSRCTSVDELDKTRYSKYIQSEVGNIFKDVQDDLKKGFKVLFVGTPCQVAGLKSFVSNGLHANLITIDIVCHAVPAPELWRGYCKEMEKKYGKIKKVVFRNKEKGWHSCFETFYFESKERPITKRTYWYLAFKHLIVRKCCSRCPYTNIHRVGDLTCGDFWGWENSHKEWNDNKGVSLAIINSEKGIELFNKTHFLKIESTIEECIQPQLDHPVLLSSSYDALVKDYQERGFSYIAKKYADWGWKIKIYNAVQLFLHYTLLGKLIH